MTVAGWDDTDGVNDTVSLAHMAESGDTGYDGVTISVVGVTVTDDDTPGVTVSETRLAVQEDPNARGRTNQHVGTYTVVLDTEPTVTAGSLTFSTSTWETAQAVTATAAADDNAVDERVTLTHTLTGAAEYAGSTGVPAVTVAAVVVTVEDDEEQGLTLNPTAVMVAEDRSEMYTVVLTSEPTAPVVVPIGSDNADVDTQPRLLQYTTSDWDTARTVRVRADAETATLTHTVVGGTTRDWRRKRWR